MSMELPSPTKADISPEPAVFQMDTRTIPKDVDLVLAAQRNRLILDWREGKATAEFTFNELLTLYWTTQARHTGSTGSYLMDSAYEFPVEAGDDLSPNLADEIYLKAQRQA